MKQETPQLRRATGLLLAAAALPLTPLAAQDTQSVADPVTVEIPPVVSEPVVAPEFEPAPATPEPAATAPAAAPPVAERSAPRPATTRTAVRTAPRTAAPARAAPPRASTPVAAEAPAPAIAADATAPLATEAAPPTAPVPVPVEAPAPADPGSRSILPWLIASALLVGLLAFLLIRRRRRDDADVDEDVYEAEPELAPAATVATETGRPWIDLDVRPIRAGVTGSDAVVEFALSVDNHGTAPARDVRIKTWMLAAGSPRESEMERTLIERPEESSLASIGAGTEERIETSLALPTSAVESDALLPVVVAEARYVLPDGSEARTSASFAVGVPDGEELAHFAIDNPSGLHDDVVAQPIDEPEHA
jgi:hypothetical protein